MNISRFTLNSLTPWIGAWLALGLACGSGADPLGDTEQPFVSGDDGATEPGAPASGGQNESAVNDAPCPGGVPPSEATGEQCQVVARGLCFSTTDAACACAGCGSDECIIAESFPAQAFCSVKGGGTDDPDQTGADPNAPVTDEPHGGGSNGQAGTTAPGSSGGSTPGCADPGPIEPTEPSPPSACADGVPENQSNGACNFIVGDTCFDSGQGACACAGCAEDVCIILESYPAQIRCP